MREKLVAAGVRCSKLGAAKKEMKKRSLPLSAKQPWAIGHNMCAALTCTTFGYTKPKYAILERTFGDIKIPLPDTIEEWKWIPTPGSLDRSSWWISLVCLNLCLGTSGANGEQRQRSACPMATHPPSQGNHGKHSTSLFQFHPFHCAGHPL